MNLVRTHILSKLKFVNSITVQFHILSSQSLDLLTGIRCCIRFVKL